MRRFLTSSPVPGPSRQSQAQEERTSSRSSLSDASIISDPADPLEDTRSLSRASSMSTSRLDTLASSSVDIVSASGEETSDHEETQGGGQALNAEEELKGSLHGLNEFFKFYKLESSQKSSKFKDKILHKGMASCCKCPQMIKFDSESRGNLKKHYKTKHPSMLSSLEAALSLNRFKPTNKIEKTSRQITLKEATERPKAWSQELAQQAYVVWFAEGLKPLCDTEDEATRTFLNILKPEFKMPCRKTLTKRLNKYAVQVKDEVKATLQDVDLVVTTADSWTSHRRAFLGCTVHWIDPITLERKAATLACRELMEKQTGRVLARNLSDIFAEFDISKKITHCTTDNGRN
ncbi:E3 SUMO-protein ligase ZBED1-like [Oratosquilla oratoria]|uniref:E3 SUMO-protein ligase ZBED1-like n=1 Tax=Oratosquilla oratoria TaxID=337810 RepID=UPI003F769F91